MVDLGWVPRDQNEEADAITNGDLVGFDPAREVKADWDFRVLDELLNLGDRFYSEMQEAKLKVCKGTEAAAQEVQKKRKVAGLKISDPW